MKNQIKNGIIVLTKSITIIIVLIIGLFIFAFMNTYVFLSKYDYVHYVDETRSDWNPYFINLKNKEWNIFIVNYLQECSSIGSAKIPEELGGLIYTEILISGEIPQIKIKDCHVEIRDINNRIIPYRSVVIEDETYYQHGLDSLYKRYNNIDEYIKTESVIDRSHTPFAVYYTYLHKSLKNVNEATLNINIKYEIDGKTYDQKINKKIFREVKEITIEYDWAVPKIVEE